MLTKTQLSINICIFLFFLFWCVSAFIFSIAILAKGSQVVFKSAPEFIENILMFSTTIIGMSILYIPDNIRQSIMVPLWILEFIKHPEDDE